MAMNWICVEDPNAPELADQIVGEGAYILYCNRPGGAGGRHVVDDFGFLQEALPQNHHQEFHPAMKLWSPQEATLH